jgi:hypothetical protein
MLLGCLMIPGALFLLVVAGVLAVADPITGGIALALFAAVLVLAWRGARAVVRS